MDLMIQILLGIVPSLGVGLLFYLVIKSLVEGDRRERRAYAQWQARQDAEDRAAAGVGDVEERPSVPEDGKRENR